MSATPPPFPLPDGASFVTGRLGAVDIWHVWRPATPADQIHVYKRPTGRYRLTPHHYDGGIGSPSGESREASTPDVGRILADMLAERTAR